ncbi:tyrosine-type recombinase/integrase [Mesoterricola silvestris]|uniref:Tyrosine recombinase XerC n=1 Tax=Mesoterricola silvestris TaxID=2927979 RepID=A0AA48K9H0_9BACT|nr:tyrosine-type recombinase/integrase [Mesoterricola silvestris]BDU72322.1 tyrosine recombinase XerC [Mesoterricola silvestris]
MRDEVPVFNIDENPEIEALREVEGVIEISPRAPIEAVVDAYIASQHPHNRKTGRNYRRDIMLAMDWMSVERPEDLRVAQLVGFHSHILATVPGKPTQAHRIIALRSFLKWTGAMQGHSLSIDQVFYLLKVPTAKVLNPHQVMNPEEIKAFLQVAKGSFRDYALCIVALGSGVRIAELCNLDVRDFLADAAGGCTVHVRQGKGGKDRMIPVRKEVRQAVDEYLESTGRRAGDAGALFLAEDRHQCGWRLSTKTASKIIRDTADKAGIRKRITPHALRHTFADSTYLYSRNLVAVKDLLGHATIATTQRYVAHLDQLDLRKAIPAYLVGGIGPRVLPEISKSETQK